MAQIGVNAVFNFHPDAPALRTPASFDVGSPGVAPVSLVPDASSYYVEEWPGSPDIEMRDDGSAIVRGYLIDWDNWFPAVRNILGYPLVVKGPTVNGVDVYYLSRKNPIYFPDCISSQHPTLNFSILNDVPRPFLWATKVNRIEGQAVPLDRITKSNTAVSRYRMARAHVYFETLTYEVKDDGEVLCSDGSMYNGLPDEATFDATSGRYVTVLSQPQSSSITLPQGTLYYAGYQNKPVVGSPPRVIPEFDIEIIWHHVPLLALGLRALNPYIATTDGNGQDYIAPIENCLGRVNLYDFNGFTKGTLLLNGAAITRVRSAIGHRLVDVHYRFKHLPLQSVDIQPDPVTGIPRRAYGPNLLPWFLAPGVDPIVGTTVPANTMGWYEAVVNPDPALFPALTSNMRRDLPLDGQNSYDYRDFKQLFRVPLLNL